MLPWSRIFFGINFTLLLLFIALSVYSVLECFYGIGSPFGLIGGVCMGVPAIPLAAAEWSLHIRDNCEIERPLGVVYFVIGGVDFVGFVTGVRELLLNPSNSLVPAEASVFGALFFTLAAYSLWCGWLRFSHRTMPELCGFPVELNVAQTVLPDPKGEEDWLL